MAAAYLVRFDDVCPTMNWRVWDQVEALLIESDIRPIVAVVPDNADADLKVASADSAFWDRVRAWQSRGWTIGLHGHQHHYVTADPGVLGLNPNSEFAGLDLEQQERKISAALAIFEQEGVEPRIWVAPGHSFDGATLEALRRRGLYRVSDGFLLRPARDESGTFWLPQQLWRFRRLPFGVWTVCLHVNGWSSDDVARFARDLGRFASRITDLEHMERIYGSRRRTFADRLFGTALLWAHRVRRRVT